MASKLIDIILWHCRRSPALTALCVPDNQGEIEKVSYYRLGVLIQVFSNKLSLENVNPNQICGVFVKDTLSHIISILALENIGATSVSIDQSLVESDLPYDFILTDIDVKPTQNMAFIVVGRDWHESKTELSIELAQQPSDALIADVRRIIMTSGSTGSPKGVCLTDEMITQRISTYDFSFGPVFARIDRVLCCMGLSSSLGYLFLMRTLVRGGMYCLPAHSLLETAKMTMSSKAKALIAPPVTLADMLSKPEVKFFNRQFELVLSAGALLSKKLAKDVQRKLSNNLISLYGTTETGVIATGVAAGLSTDFGAVGYVVPSVKVKLKNLDEAVDLGCLGVKSGANADHYWGGASTEINDSEGFFWSGDLAKVTDNDLVVYQGRSDNVLNLGGYKTTVEQIEIKLIGAPGVSELAIYPIADQDNITKIVVFVCANDNWKIGVFWEFCQTKLRQVTRPQEICTVSTIPKNRNGKFDRSKFPSLFSSLKRAE